MRAFSMTLSHSAAPILSGQMIARTALSRLSAAVPGKRAEPSLPQPGQKFGHLEAERLRSLRNLEGREGVDVHVGNRLLHGTADLDIGLA